MFGTKCRGTEASRLLALASNRVDGCLGAPNDTEANKKITATNRPNKPEKRLIE